MVKKVAILTAGGFAPCLSSAIGGLISRYTEVAPDVELIAYMYGYQGLLTGNSVPITDNVRRNAGVLHGFGGSPIGNSRVKLTNVKDCVKRGLVPEGSDPLQVAADQLVVDGVDVLHTIGGDDTNTTAADLAKYLATNDYGLTVVGLPKTIDNDVYPIKQTLGADTASEQASLFAQNVLSEHNAGTRVLLIHEVMGRNCGWLTAAAARRYREWLDKQTWLPEIGHSRAAWDVHGVFVPEVEIDIPAEAQRLKQVMDEVGNVNLFISEGAGINSIIADMERNGQEIARDAFGHIRLERINPGNWFGKQFAAMLNAEKTLVQKSGYFSRSAAPNQFDLDLIRSMTDMAVDCGLAGTSGVIGHDEDNGDVLTAIDFARIKGGKPFDFEAEWFGRMLADIGQGAPRPASNPAAH